jgi:predicted protein tyrosine phosphatase
MRWHALVILDSGVEPTGFVAAHTLSHEYLVFDDIESPRPTRRPPTEALIEQGLKFAAGKERLLVCCRAGQGRSASMAYLIRCRDVGAPEAVALLDPTRHRPNRLVVELGDRLLSELQPLQAFDDWRHRHGHIRLSDYYDEMEREIDRLVEAGARDLITGQISA